MEIQIIEAVSVTVLKPSCDGCMTAVPNGNSLIYGLPDSQIQRLKKIQNIAAHNME